MDTDRTLVEGWLGPYLAAESSGGARRIVDLPAGEARAAVALDPSCDPGAFDGLPGVLMLCDAALAIHPDATLAGLLIDADRPDARLHLDTVHVPGHISVQEVLAGAASVIPEGEDLDPDAVERHGDRWQLWWD